MVYFSFFPGVCIKLCNIEERAISPQKMKISKKVKNVFGEDHM